MDNIIKFPTKQVRDKASIEKTIQDILKQTPLSQEMIDELTERHLGIWERYKCEFPTNFSIPFPASSTEDEQKNIIKSLELGIKDFEKSLNDHMNALILERINAESRLYAFEKGLT